MVQVIWLDFNMESIGGAVTYSGNYIESLIRGAAGDPRFGANRDGYCPACLSDFTTDPDSHKTYIKKMRERFGDDTPEVKN